MSSFMQYLQDTRAELRHVAWPTQTQTIVFTSLVVAVSIFISLYLGFFDFLFTGTLERFVNANAGIVDQTAQTASTSSSTITPITSSTTKN